MGLRQIEDRLPGELPAGRGCQLKQTFTSMRMVYILELTLQKF